MEGTEPSQQPDPKQALRWRAQLVIRQGSQDDDDGISQESRQLSWAQLTSAVTEATLGEHTRMAHMAAQIRSPQASTHS
jgi:hypothetical protein